MDILLYPEVIIYKPSHFLENGNLLTALSLQIVSLSNAKSGTSVTTSDASMVTVNAASTIWTNEAN